MIIYFERKVSRSDAGDGAAFRSKILQTQGLRHVTQTSFSSVQSLTHRLQGPNQAAKSVRRLASITGLLPIFRTQPPTSPTTPTTRHSSHQDTHHTTPAPKLLPSTTNIFTPTNTYYQQHIHTLWPNANPSIDTLIARSHVRRERRKERDALAVEG